MGGGVQAFCWDGNRTKYKQVPQVLPSSLFQGQQEMDQLVIVLFNLVGHFGGPITHKN